MQWIKLDDDSITEDLFLQLIELENSCGLEPYTPDMLRDCISELDTYAWLDDNMIAGFTTLQPGTSYLGGGIYIVNLNVGASYRRQGLGRSLLLTALAQYGHSHQGRIVTLDVAKHNFAALELYKKLGFYITDLPSGNGPSDYVMVAELDRLLGTYTTERLSLRPMIPDDAAVLADILRDELVKVTYMVPDLEPDAAHQLALRIVSLSIDPKRYIRGIYKEEQLIGLINDVEISDGSIELGWVISPSQHNKGYATEAVSAAIDDLFARGYQRVVAGAFAENKASIRVMEKAGMQPLEKAEELEYRGKVHTCVYFGRCKY